MTKAYPTITQLMNEQGLTYEQLAEKSGVNKYVIRRIEQKRFKRVMVSDVLKLSQTLNSMFDMEPINEDERFTTIPRIKIDLKKENGKSLRNLRKEYGITIKHLAEATNLTENEIKKIERHDFTQSEPYEFAALIKYFGRFFAEVFMQNPNEAHPE